MRHTVTHRLPWLTKFFSDCRSPKLSKPFSRAVCGVSRIESRTAEVNLGRALQLSASGRQSTSASCGRNAGTGPWYVQMLPAPRTEQNNKAGRRQSSILEV